MIHLLQTASIVSAWGRRVRESLPPEPDPDPDPEPVWDLSGGTLNSWPTPAVPTITNNVLG